MPEKYTSKTHPALPESRFFHILQLSFIDLMILFCEMHLFSLEAFKQIHQKTILFVILSEKTIFYCTLIYIYNIQYTYLKNHTFETLFSLQMT